MSFGKIGDCDKHNDREGVGCGQMSMRRFSYRDECSYGGSQYDER